VAGSALTRVRSRGRSPEELERAVLTRVVRDRRCRRGTIVTGTPLDDLRPPQRASVVLAFALGWEPTAIADARRTTPGRVRRDVAGGLAVLGEDEWRQLFAQGRWSVPPPADLVDRARADVSASRRRHRRAVLGAASVVVMVAGAATVVVRLVNAPPPLPPTAHVPGLLAWPARGPLVRDAGLVASAVGAWRTDVRRPDGDVYALYAGRPDGRRLVVLQALDATGVGAVAVVGEAAADRTLRVTTVVPITSPDAPAVVLCCGLGGAGLQGGPGPLTERLLVAPGVTGVEERSAVGATPDVRPPFVQRALVGGLSAPWPVDPGGPAAPAVHISGSRGSVFAGIVDTGSGQLLEVDPALRAPSSRWRGLPRTLPVTALTDDVLWWAQQCGQPQPSVQLVWVGGAPAFPAPVRLELVRCGGEVSAAFLTGFADGTALLDVHRGRADAYATEFPAPPAFGLGTLLVVGSSRVDSIELGDKVVEARVARTSLREAGRVRVFDAAGQRLMVR
jgi:hypothetical protein